MHTHALILKKTTKNWGEKIPNVCFYAKSQCKIRVLKHNMLLKAATNIYRETHSEHNVSQDLYFKLCG